MMLNNKFLTSKGKLKDSEIVKALRQTADDYENGEIVEVHDLLEEIVDAIESFND